MSHTKFTVNSSLDNELEEHVILGNWLTIGIDGYEDACGCKVIIIVEPEPHSSTLEVRVWSDRDQQDPTHTISLEGVLKKHGDMDSG